MSILVTREEIINFNNLFKELKTYAAVARATGRSPGTIKKYIVSDYVSQGDIAIVEFDGSRLSSDVPDLSQYVGNLGVLCEIWDSEREEYEELRKEIAL